MSAAHALPWLTADLPGIGGTLRTVPEDFAVEELPAYEPVGEGSHLFLWIEKRDVSAEELLRHLARTLGISRADIGAAGLKDRRAVTRQFVSVPAACADRIELASTSSIRILDCRPHGNKLRTGHLRGNRFSIVIRDVADDAADRAVCIAAAVQETGFPNYYGSQRFGIDDETLTTGLALVAGRLKPAGIPYVRRKFLMRLSLSAVQSHLFNRVLAERIDDGLLARVLPGDVMQVAASGGLFVVENATTEQQRADAGETTVTGPLFGPKMKPPQAEPADRERRVLQSAGLDAAAFTRYPKLTSGTRRPLVVRPGGLTVDGTPDGIRLQFTLPAGCYATSLLREFRKETDGSG